MSTRECYVLPSPGSTDKPEKLPAAVFDSVLPEALFRRLKEDFIDVVDYSEPPPENENAFVTGTYWYSLSSNKKGDEDGGISTEQRHENKDPCSSRGDGEGERDDSGKLKHRLHKNAVELAIEYITKSLGNKDKGLASIMEKSVGCEWWFQEQGPKDVPKEFHTDVNIKCIPDEENDDAKKMVHEYPLMSSVFYFGYPGRGRGKKPREDSCEESHTNVDDNDDDDQDTLRMYPHLQSPTVIFGQADESPDRLLSPALPSKVMACFPRRNRLLVFQGDLFHAVVSPWKEGGDKKTAPRPSAVMLESSVAEEVSKVKPTSEGKSTEPTNATTQQQGGWEIDTRYTLLVNWWGHRPEGPLVLPEKTCKKPSQRRCSSTGKSSPDDDSSRFGSGTAYSSSSSLGLESTPRLVRVAPQQVDFNSDEKQDATSVFAEHAKEWKEQRLPFPMGASTLIEKRNSGQEPSLASSAAKAESAKMFPVHVINYNYNKDAAQKMTAKLKAKEPYWEWHSGSLDILISNS